MSQIKVNPLQSMGWGFISGPHVPAGKDEHYIRDEQSGLPASHWRALRKDEVERLIRNGNTADDWKNVRAAEDFDPELVRNCRFFGLVRIGRLEKLSLEFHDLAVPVGLRDSTIISCDLGDNVAVDNVRHMAHYIIGGGSMLLNIGEMNVTNHARFGNGCVKAGEDESSRMRLDLGNESGGRSVMPFDGMLAADACLWACRRDDGEFLAALEKMTQAGFDPRRGFYGSVGEGCVIKNCGSVKDVRIGPCAYVKGANKLKNLTINSSAAQPTQIGEGVELVNGVIGRGCRVFYGSKAVRFVMGDNSSLKYGARLIHSYLGDNSTVSCCEILNDLVLPAHEQHHNNSFLIAATVMGQSNIAAGATIGSNHNTRAPDGEIHAGRGFWPGLCVSLKHNCRFASFTLIATGEYHSELDVPLPFSLVSNDAPADRLAVMPAYWWLYDMYALARNSWKFRDRDTRKDPRQHIEFDFLAPDTAEEIFAAMALLEAWAAKADLPAEGVRAAPAGADELAAIGRGVLLGPKADFLEILGENIEHSRRKVVILKAGPAYRAYRQMLHYYAVRNLLEWFAARPSARLADMYGELGWQRERRWVNLGGQLVRGDDFDALRAGVKAGRVGGWDAVHAEYDRLWKKYPLDKQRHAFGTLLEVLGGDGVVGKPAHPTGSGKHDRTAEAAGKPALPADLTPRKCAAAVDEAVAIQRHICEQTYLSRKKDFDNPFRRMVYANAEEMKLVLGTAEDAPFVLQTREATAKFEALAEEVKKRG